MAYILGFFAADGYITLHKNGGLFWSIEITDKKLIMQIRKSIRSEHKITIRKGRNKNEKSLYRLQIGSKEMCNDLFKLGFHNKKTQTLTTPKVPHRYFPDFVRGYFDGDGNVWIGNVHKKRKTQTLVIQTAFTSSSVNFLRQLQLDLFKFGVERGSLYNSKKGYARLQFSVGDSLKLYKIMYNSNCYLFSDRKKVVFEKFIKMRL